MMRMAILLLVGGAAGLAACSSENGIREQVREQIVSACTSQSGASNIPGIDPQAFCTCLGERAVANRSVEELRQLTGDNGRAAGAEAGRQCVAELSRRGGQAQPEEGAEAANASVNDAAEEASEE